ncbi:DUF421 domain-containing protein [Pontibacter sp. HSC-36F09]|uniref:DUF421 domain-containing protein n=1 Tax=Pontibacter sp. HSC-36F09 TaxID=2910966 RepID=UPI00209D309B|nr:YetF domain-containing protein [Pontibacter sp. HSC-36F09]MCP2045327.1 uncharacterized membrane protein YcaP (DUF421 family) [Pontibacter sp. HSC-36F09]
MELLQINLSELFRIETPILELVLRTTVLYLGILFLLRIVPRRTGGELATMDLLFVVLIAEATTHSLGGYKSITEGFIVILTLMVLNYAINFLSYYSPFIEKLVSSPALLVVKDGKLLRRNMRREFLTEEELMEHLRREGIENVKDVKSAHVEADGHISFISKNGDR